MTNSIVRILARTNRYVRQTAIYDWAIDTFGSIARARPECARRLLEEAIEVVQAAGLSEELALVVLRYVYGRPVCDVRQEIGQLGVSLLAFAENLGIDADAEEAREFDRIVSLPPWRFQRRQNEKAEAGIAERTVEP